VERGKTAARRAGAAVSLRVACAAQRERGREGERERERGREGERKRAETRSADSPPPLLQSCGRKGNGIHREDNVMQSECGEASPGGGDACSRQETGLEATQKNRACSRRGTIALSHCRTSPANTHHWPRKRTAPLENVDCTYGIHSTTTARRQTSTTHAQRTKAEPKPGRKAQQTFRPDRKTTATATATAATATAIAIAIAAA